MARRALDAAGPVAPRGEPPPEPQAALLAAFDTTMLGYGSRTWIVPVQHDRRVLKGGGMLRPVVLVGGEAAGTWRLPQGRLEVDWFGPRADLTEEEADVRRFLAG
jgi:hypothetical protein